MVAHAPGYFPGTARTPLVGREREQALLRDALARALAGCGGLVLLGGEAGIGKTALAEALLTEAVALGAQVLVGRCYDLSGTPPYGPWREIGLFARRGTPDRLTPERRRILDFLREQQQATPAAVAAGLGLTPANAAQALRRLLARGLVAQASYGSYTLPPESAVGSSQTGQSGWFPLTDVPPLGMLGEGERSVPRGREALFEQARGYLAALAAQQPLVLLLEDLHWADPASLDLLRVIARNLANLPLLLVATYRVDALTRRHPLSSLLPALAREIHPVRFDLRPLAETALRALIEASYPLPVDENERLAAYLHGRAEGNPFYTGELLRTLEEAEVLRREGARWRLGDPAAMRVPALLRQVIDARVAHLGAGARDLLMIAAVLGQEVSFGLWAEVGGVDEAALLAATERALEARLLAESGDGSEVCFAHALVRDALYEGTSVLRRRMVHRQAGEILLAGPHPDPDLVAHHLGRARDPRAFEWLVRAGLHALRTAAWLSAAERFAAAAALPDPEGDRTRTRAWLQYSRAQLLAFSDNAACQQAQEAAGPLAVAAGDRVLMCHVRIAHGILRALAGDIRRGLAEAERGVAELEAVPIRQHLRFGLEAGLATLAAILEDAELIAAFPPPVAPPVVPYRFVLVNWFGHTGRYREALELGEALLGALDIATGETAPAPVHFGLGHARAALGHPDAAISAYARSREMFTATGNAHMIGFAIWSALQLAYLPYRADDVAERTRLIAESAGAWERARGTMTETPHADPTGLLPALLEGRWAEAERVARDTLVAATAGHAHGAIVALGVLAWLRGDPDSAWVRVRELHPAGPATQPGDCYFHHGVALQALAAHLALDAGDTGLARDWIAAHARWLGWSGAVLWRTDQRLLRSCLARAVGDYPAASAHAEAALALASDPRQPLAMLAAHRTLGELAIDDRHHAAATIHLAAALALADACAAPYERALTQLALATLHTAEARYEAAAAALAEARAAASDLGAAPALARIDALAATLDARRGARPVAVPGRLSRRELEVLRHLATGRSTQQIAEALYLSPRTVKRHIANTYLKIGAHGRAEAIAYARQYHLV